MFEIVRLYEARTQGYHTYRIPAVIATPGGAAVVFCEARRGTGDDWSAIDILMRRSEDDGRTWSEPRRVAGHPTLPLSNATPIIDRQTSSIHFLYQVNYANVYYMRSDDDAQSFSAPVDITHVFEGFRRDYDWTVICPGPGQSIQLRSGRLVVPIWMSNAPRGQGHGHRPSIVSTIYSDDRGGTWHRGEVVVRHSELVPNPSETVALELEDGRVLLNIRNESKTCRRIESVSSDGATGWSEPTFRDDLFEPVCFASMRRLTTASESGDGRGRVLFCNPDSSRNPSAWQYDGWHRARENITVRLSYDDTRTWPVAKVIDPGAAGYTDLAVLPSGTVLCAYEGGQIEHMFDNAHLSVARFDLGWLTDGKAPWPYAPRGAAAPARRRRGAVKHTLGAEAQRTYMETDGMTAIVDSFGAEYEAKGYALVQSGIDRPAIDAMRATITKAVDALAHKLKREGKTDDLHESASFERRLVLLANGSDLGLRQWDEAAFSPALYDLITHPGLLDVLEPILGPDITFHGDHHLRPKLPGSSLTAFPWHQDSQYYGEPTKDMHVVTVTVPLVDLTEANGCLWMIPGSHKWGYLAGERGADQNIRTFEDVERRGTPVPMPMKIGDVLPFTNLTFHNSRVNTTDGVRWTLDLRYSATREAREAAGDMTDAERGAYDFMFAKLRSLNYRPVPVRGRGAGIGFERWAAGGA